MRIVAAVIVGLLLAAGVAWNAAAQHYTGCVQAAVARHPVPEQTELERLQASEQAARGQRLAAAGVRGCSRFP